MTAKQRAARAKFKAVVAEAKKLRKKNPKLTQAQAVKQAFAISYGKKRAGVGAVNKKAAPKKKAATKVKAKKRRSTEMHTDTKSHNVNIRVVSGFKDMREFQLKRLRDLVYEREHVLAMINKIDNYIRETKLVSEKKRWRNERKKYVVILSKLRRHIDLVNDELRR